MIKPHFSPIVPPQAYPDLRDRGHLGLYNLILAQEVIQFPSTFEDVFQKQFDSVARTLILDNGVVETGTALEPKVLLEAAKICRASVVVLPDVIQDPEASWEVTEYASEWFKREDPGLELMVVPQGKTLGEVGLYIKRAYEELHFHWFGIPRWMTKAFGTRSEIIKHALRYNRKVHMLGFSDNLLDDIACARTLDVRGIDSAYPIALGYQTLPIMIGRRNMTAQRDKGWDQHTLLYDSCCANIRRVRAWLGQLPHDAS